MQKEETDEVKNWVLAVSVDKQFDRVLINDRRGVYEASLLNSDGSLCEPCVITGKHLINK